MRRVSFSLVVLLALTVLSTSVTANQSSADETKMSKELIEELSGTGDLEVIVQFNGPSSARLWQALESMGAEVLGELSVLDGGLISASPISLAKISRLSIVRHMELNIPLEYFFLPGDQDDVESMMHETIHVVNASMAWHRVIIGTDGVIKTESDLSFTEYDGEGATAVDLDTGIDGEHPDFDCGEPWSGEKLMVGEMDWTSMGRRTKLQFRYILGPRDSCRGNHCREWRRLCRKALGDGQRSIYSRTRNG